MRARRNGTGNNGTSNADPFANPREAERAAKRRLEDVLQHLVERRRIVDSDRRHIVVSVVDGEPAREIARRAHHARAELVVIGRSGTKSLRDWVLGSSDDAAFSPEWVARCLDSLGVAERCNVIMRAGEARQLIVDAASERKCDLVSLGTKGRTGLASVISSSVAESVLGSIACDVLIARSPRPDFDLR